MQTLAVQKAQCVRIVETDDESSPHEPQASYSNDFEALDRLTCGETPPWPEAVDAPVDAFAGYMTEAGPKYLTNCKSARSVVDKASHAP